jgi:hypothetical protein
MRAPPQATLIKWGIYAAIIVVLIFSVRAFFGNIKEAIFGDPEVTQAKGETVVAEEEGKAAVTAGKAGNEALVQRFEYHRETERIVRDGQANVNAAYKGGKIDADVHNAGIAALCGLHGSLCPGSETIEVQRDDPGDGEGGDPARPGT